jgi:hypothetical protein
MRGGLLFVRPGKEKDMHEALQGTAYLLLGIGTVALGVAFVWGYIAYRRRAGRDQVDIERRSAKWRPR